MPSPPVLPSFAKRFTVVSSTHADWESLELPETLRDAVPKRQQEFLAGRYCVARAMEQLDPVHGPALVGRRSAGNPQWPAGVTGSLTHTGRFASAAVAWISDVRSIGIDTERLERFDAPSGTQRLVMRPEEALLGGPALDPRLRLPLVFSAKEAIFKCLYPLVERFFSFEDAALEVVDLQAGTFSARPTSALAPGIGPALRIEGQFAFGGGYVHTGVWVP